MKRMRGCRPVGGEATGTDDEVRRGGGPSWGRAGGAGGRGVETEHNTGCSRARCGTIDEKGMRSRTRIGDLVGGAAE